MNNHDLQLLESARKMLNASASTLQELVTASNIIENFHRETDEKLRAEIAAREKTLRTSTGSAAAIESTLAVHDDTISSLKRRSEIARATGDAIIQRVDAMKAAEGDRQQRAFHDATAQRLARGPAVVKSALAEMTKIGRATIREVAEIDRDVVKVNANLPSGCAPLAMFDATRRAQNPEPSLRELRRSRYYVDSGGGRVLGAETQVNATLRQDGSYDVMLPGGATSGGISTIATLHEFVEAEMTEYPAPAWPEQLATALKIPGLTLADPPGWEIVTDRGEPAFPDEILARLDDLEHRVPAEPRQPRVSVKLIPANKWDAEHPQSNRKAA